MSTTTNREVAMQYAKRENKPDKAATVMEIQMGMLERGADLAWLSQVVPTWSSSPGLAGSRIICC